VALFLFGTLMDLDVTRQIVDRPFLAAEMEPATLPGHRRVGARNATYPILVPDAAASVRGLLFPRPSPRDLVRIRHFESEEYETVPVLARNAAGRLVRAEVFSALAGAFETTGEPWDLDLWVQRHKDPFLRRCREWMADCPGTPADVPA
jgi:hypothetical protein